MNFPACSVVIIAYNSRDFLPACLHSIQEALENLDGQVIVLTAYHSILLSVQKVKKYTASALL